VLEQFLGGCRVVDLPNVDRVASGNERRGRKIEGNAGKDEKVRDVAKELKASPWYCLLPPRDKPQVIEGSALGRRARLLDNARREELVGTP
jgi:hypothetical protein